MKYPKQTIYGKIPSKSNSYKIITINGHPSLAKQPIMKEYEKNFFIQCAMRGKSINGYFKLELDVFYENLRPDLDNCFKALLDCLQMCRVIKNDRQCVEITARKFVDKKNPRIEFILEEVEI